MKFRRVVVTGLGALTPIGNTIPEYWNNLINGVSGARPITKFDASKFKTKFACEVKNYEPSQFFDRKELRKHDLFSQYALVCTDEAIVDSKIDFEKTDCDRVGVIWGSGIGGITTFLDEVKGFIKGNEIPRFNPFFIPKMISDIAAGHISIKYGLKGPNFTTTSACASAANAIIDAALLIQSGLSDVMVSGGSEAAVNEVGMGGFGAMHAISTRNDAPEIASRPFDKNRDGFVLGEGGGALILEELEHAKKRGAKIYAEIAGYGLTADAHHITSPHPEGEGAYKVMRNALQNAQIEPDTVDHINTHGTSTPLGDIAEPKAITKLFGAHAPKISINSTKSMTGHLLGAAGAIEAIAGILAMQHSTVPPTINFEELDPEIDKDLDFTFNKAKERNINYVLSNTFGFGGHNACIIFKKFSE